MEHYFDIISNFSFGSRFLSLTTPTASALVAKHESFLQTHLSDFDDCPLLLELASAIDAEKKSANWPCVFVRLSSRSPKDAALSSPKFSTLFQEEKTALDAEESGISDSNATNRTLHALYRASTWALRTYTGAEAVRLLIEADRTYDDLKLYAEGKMNTANFNVVVREFRSFLPEMEFRGFVYNGAFTSLTQYNEFCYFPRLVSMREAIAAKIQAEFKTMMQMIPLQSYVVDFVLAPQFETLDRNAMSNVDTLKLFVVELNPLAEFAGTGLFSWEKDKAVLLGASPFEFRCHMGHIALLSMNKLNMAVQMFIM
jgi:hypothetical protein